MTTPYITMITHAILILILFLWGCGGQDFRRGDSQVGVGLTHADLVIPPGIADGLTDGGPELEDTLKGQGTADGIGDGNVDHGGSGSADNGNNDGSGFDSGSGSADSGSGAPLSTDNQASGSSGDGSGTSGTSSADGSDDGSGSGSDGSGSVDGTDGSGSADGTGSGSADGMGGADGDPATVPGEPVTRVGIHFEDGTDNDFNDLSYCFEGLFKVSGRNIISISDQRLVVKVHRISGGEHVYHFRIHRKTGGLEFEHTAPIQMRETQTIRPSISFGSRIEAFTYAAGRLLPMHQARVEKNVCRNTGI